MMSKHYIIYKTTNLLNGRYYIGMHETACVDDGYLGSGRRIKAEIKKYGRENFKREVIKELDTRQEMIEAEAALVTEDLRQDPLCLNLKNGGSGGQDKSVAVANWQSEEYRQSQAEGLRQKWQSDENYRLTTVAHSSETMRQTHAAGKIKYDTFTGRKHSEETKQKMRESKRLRDLQRTNGVFGSLGDHRTVYAG
jgi:hypothetical protein